MTIDEFNNLVNADIQERIRLAQINEEIDQLLADLQDAKNALERLQEISLELDRTTSALGMRSVAGQIAAMKAITAQANVLRLEKQIRGASQ
jgi:GTP1/Obg family GTP-binding protein